jgi:hypothetical protein
MRKWVNVLSRSLPFDATEQRNPMNLSIEAVAWWLRLGAYFLSGLTGSPIFSSSMIYGQSRESKTKIMATQVHKVTKIS